jgi:pilus assembly protein CpaC
MENMSKSVWWMGLAGVVTLTGMVQEAAAQAPDKEFTIAIGETLTFSGAGVTRVTVGLENVASVKPTSDNSQVLVTGLQPGVTTLNFYSSRGQKTLLVRVVQVNPVALAEEVREVLGDRSGVDVRVVKGRVLLEGEVASQVFKNKIDQLVQLYPSQVLNFTMYRESFVEGAKMVALDIDFIQLATTSRDQLGANWGQFFGANMSFGSGDVPLYYTSGQGIGQGILPGEADPNRLPNAVLFTGGSGFKGYWSLVGNLNMALDLLVENGLVKTIQHGTMVTEGGREAEFSSGGTLLILAGGFQAGQLLEKPYGLVVKAKPIVDVDNRVKVELTADYSELDQANGVGGIPALKNSRFFGVVNMQEGQSVLISGISATQTTENNRGWFLLEKIPILGWAFKQRAFLEQSTNNALFVTPRIYEPGGNVHRTLVLGIFEKMLKVGAEAEELPKLSNAPAKARPATTPKPADSKPADGSATDAFKE